MVRAARLSTSSTIRLSNAIISWELNIALPEISAETSIPIALRLVIAADFDRFGVVSKLTETSREGINTPTETKKHNPATS